MIDRQLSKNPDSSSRTSSGSRSSESEVKPTRSQNSADTRRRSVVGPDGPGSDSRALGEEAADPARGAPQRPQKASSGSLGAPQATQDDPRGAPHREQNRRSGRFSARQRGQTKKPPLWKLSHRPRAYLVAAAGSTLPWPKWRRSRA